jgi:subtilisin family serine protease
MDCMEIKPIVGTPGAVRVIGPQGDPLQNVRIYRQIPAGKWEQVGVTDKEGIQRWKIDPDILPVTLLFQPSHTYWDAYRTFKSLSDSPIDVRLEALPTEGRFGWWHRLVGRTAGHPGAGEGIRVGLVDTGLGPSPCLGHVERAGAWIDGTHLLKANACIDVTHHGTHVAGILAAHGCGDTHYAGLAPAVEAIMVRVFREDSKSADDDDIANAIEYLSREEGVHLINLSLGHSVPSVVEHEAILDAREVGTLILAAAGNEGAEVEYPAAYPEVVAVSSIGKVETGSDFARAGGYIADSNDVIDGIYIASFSAQGHEVNCTAPGVEIISTVPSPGPSCALAAMSGTSMSAPIACGAVANYLATDPTYLGMGPTSKRVDYALKVLEQECRSLGFGARREGWGLPTVP